MPQAPSTVPDGNGSDTAPRAIAESLRPVGEKSAYAACLMKEFGVIGGREQCEPFPDPFDVKALSGAGDDSMHMTEPCTGPFYFRRVSQQATP